jgi:hypothetical protein
VDESLLLNERRVVLDEPITALHDLAHRFYHVDIALPDLPGRQVRRAGNRHCSCRQATGTTARWRRA